MQIFSVELRRCEEDGGHQAPARGAPRHHPCSFRCKPDAVSFLRPSPARVARARHRRGPAPPPPRTCSSDAKDLRRPIASPPPPRTRSSDTQNLRRQGRARPSPRTCATKLLAPSSPRTCSSATQDLGRRRQACAADIPSRHPGSAPPPPRTCTRLGVELSGGLGTQALARAWTSSFSSFCCSSATCCSSPARAAAGVPLRMLPMRRITGLLACSSPVPDLCLSPSISSKRTSSRSTWLGPVPCCH